MPATTCTTCGGDDVVDNALCTDCFGLEALPVCGDALFKKYILEKIADVEDKVDDVMDKCNDIYEAVTE